MSSATLDPAPAASFTPGSLVRARDREWVVQPGSSASLLRLRPLGGSEEDITTLIPELEPTPPGSATFPPPDPAKPGNHTAALLLRDALQLKLRAGAGPFRSFANIAVEPRAYQLVPLLMALRQSTVRLLIADDVGIGKTIEAGLIARELWDRGEITRFAVLCPPHLVDQWQAELARHFHFQAAALTASSVSKLERDLPHGVSLFDHHSIVVVSLDYIKTERHRDHFLSIAPECVIVDEAHGCAAAGKGKQLRLALLQKLAEDNERHLLLLTATPHSGDESSFDNLLGLLHPKFANLSVQSESQRAQLLDDLALHFVQRRRQDIDEWKDSTVFPRRQVAEFTYQLTGAWGEFFDAVQDYCAGLASRVEARADSPGRHMIWYATLALLRCVGSSPAAAERALTTRLDGGADALADLAEDDRLKDGDDTDLATSDLEPAGVISESDQLKALIQRARDLRGTQDDPKLKALTKHLTELIKKGARPVVFCRYVATADYVAEYLREHFPQKISIQSVTGQFTPEERELRVVELAESEQPILVATDCLSEGINLQHGFDAVIHYDLAWNPTRHEQREGRVDRFGQKTKEVYCAMLYGQDNPVDGFILRVIMRKAEVIRGRLGVLVPVPEDSARINHAMIKAALLKRSQAKRHDAQLGFDFDEALSEDLPAIETLWEDAIAKAKKNTTRFAQRRLKPAEVMPEWRRQLDLIGDESAIARFVQNACLRLGSPLEKSRQAWRFVPKNLPPELIERLAQEGIEKDQDLVVDFHYPPASRAQFIHRTHPLVSLLADHLIEGVLQGSSTLAARCAVTETADVSTVTTLFLLRLRHQLTSTRRGATRTLIAEETVPIALEGRANPRWLTDETQLRRLLEVSPSGNLSAGVISQQVTQALDLLRASKARLETLAHERVEALLKDHRRVRDAADDLGSYSIKASLPVDVIGVYVLLPAAL